MSLMGAGCDVASVLSRKQRLPAHSVSQDLWTRKASCAAHRMRNAAPVRTSAHANCKVAHWVQSMRRSTGPARAAHCADPCRNKKDRRLIVAKRLICCLVSISKPLAQHVTSNQVLPGSLWLMVAIAPLIPPRLQQCTRFSMWRSHQRSSQESSCVARRTHWQTY